MFDFIDCLEAEMVPGYETKRPPRFGGDQAGAAAGGARPEEPTIWDVGRGGSSCPVLGIVAGTPWPGWWHPASVL